MTNYIDRNTLGNSELNMNTDCFQDFYLHKTKLQFPGSIKGFNVRVFNIINLILREMKTLRNIYGSVPAGLFVVAVVFVNLTQAKIWEMET